MTEHSGQESGSEGRMGTAFLIASDELGTGPSELGRLLMRSFLKTTLQLETKPGRILFLNTGVRLTTEGSEILDDLRALERTDVEILSCGTCLDYFHLKEKLQAGRVGTMHEIVQTLMAADRVVRP